jgi:uncharacterized membrane protein
MNDSATPDKRPRPRTAIRLWLLLAAMAAIVVAANAHLIHVATTSQPACVTHLKQGEGDATRGLFSAARSACSPAPPVNVDNS